jgi:pyrroline-5-carboxylate reductase
MTLTLPGPLLLVGAGKMGHALLEGWLDQGVPASQLFVRDPLLSEETAAMIVGRGVSLGASSFPPAIVVLAVKPQALDQALEETRTDIRDGTLVLSIAAGRSIASISRHVAPGASVVRAMPNTPAAIARGMTVACAGPGVTDEHREVCEALLGAVGEVAWIEDEAQMDAVTAVSGSGPAYVFHLAEALTDAGVAAGLDPLLAARLAEKTIAGAGALIERSGLTPEELRRNVTSKGGTTEAALQVLMQDETGLKALMRRAVEAAAGRSRELGD